MPLTNHQRAALRYIEWYLDPSYRRSGRTLISAIAVIRIAARNPGSPVDYQDHYPTLNSRDMLRSLVDDIISRHPSLNDHAVLRQDSLLFTQNMPPIQAWEPDLSYYLSGYEAGYESFIANYHSESRTYPIRHVDEITWGRPSELSEEAWQAHIRAFPLEPPKSSLELPKPKKPLLSLMERILRDGV